MFLFHKEEVEIMTDIGQTVTDTSECEDEIGKNFNSRRKKRAPIIPLCLPPATTCPDGYKGNII